jgi:hypothetical protein
MERIIIIIIITAAVLLGTVAAQAGQTDSYHDLIRPNGKMRSDAVHEADLNFCYQQTGQSRFLPDGAAFKKCMAGRGYSFTGLTGSATDASAPSLYDTSPWLFDPPQ